MSNPKIEVGDICYIISSGLGGIRYREHQVMRETATLLVLTNGRKFRKSNLREFGDRYGAELTPWSEKIRTAHLTQSNRDVTYKEISNICGSFVLSINDREDLHEIYNHAKSINTIIAKYEKKTN